MRTRYTLLFVLACVVCAVPLVRASALTDDEIRAQINTLIGRIQNLQEQMKTLTLPTTTPPAVVSNPTPAMTAPQQLPAKTCARITRALSLGARGSDVSELQTYLVGTGDLDADSATGYFGNLTRAALRAYQAREGIVSDGDEQTTGWGMVGARTRARMACGGDNARGATLSVSQSGKSVTVRTTINTRKSCAASTYILDYGDKTPTQDMPVLQNSCAAQALTFIHTYSAPGQYLISVTNGSLSVSLPVSVTDEISCTPPSFSISSVPGGMVGAMYSFPFASFSEDKDAKSSLDVTAEKLPQGIVLTSKASSTATSSNTVVRSWSLVGTPVQAGKYTSSITAKNRCGSTSVRITIPIAEAVRGINCPVYQQPVCGSGASLRSGGYDSNGCVLSAVCVPNPVVCTDVTFQIPQCAAGQHIETQYDSSGCRVAPVCVSDSTLNATPSSGVAPLRVNFSWDRALAPTGIDFGNGTNGTWQDGIPSGITYTYASPGVYTASLYKMVNAIKTVLGSVVINTSGNYDGGM